MQVASPIKLLDTKGLYWPAWLEGKVGSRERALAGEWDFFLTSINRNLSLWMGQLCSHYPTLNQSLGYGKCQPQTNHGPLLDLGGQSHSKSVAGQNGCQGSTTALIALGAANTITCPAILNIKISTFRSGEINLYLLMRKKKKLWLVILLFAENIFVA